LRLCNDTVSVIQTSDATIRDTCCIRTRK